MLLLRSDCRSSKLTVTCTNCDTGVVIRDETAKTSAGKNTKMLENNVKGVFEAVNNNIGITGLNRIISILGIDTFSQGVGFVVEVDTGLIIDREVISNFCQVCSSREKRQLPATPEWMARHASSCNRNYTGTSASMGTEAARHLWSWSTQLGLRRGEADKTKFCRKHSTKPGYFSKIPSKHRGAILKVYTDLTNEDLLKRCLKGRTQNANESLHSKLWMKVAKHKFAGISRVNFISQVVILEHI
ncbi:hypothetical protein Pmani_022772 [Petrolisthes manimaculis]|uniref:Mutator-like transposase domain-containing protein n=1 Tax=Petrolisthes manimaculis TaxID=1843537 RepID=A0AAE1U406_9EUCA|nr:hypothetical protein Pmani_022772 [Petrolisthes manimaculis]